MVNTKNYYTLNALPNKNGAYYISDVREVWYYVNNILHKEDGPAIENIYDGIKEWWFNGQRHRLDGPAYETIYEYKTWYYHGKLIKCSSQQEFEKLIKLQAFW